MSFVLQELVGTEKEYVDKMNDIIKVGVAAYVIQMNYVINVYRIIYLKCCLVNCLSLWFTRTELSLATLRNYMHSTASEYPTVLHQIIRI